MALFGKSRRKLAEEYAAFVASPETVWVWTQGNEGPYAVPGRRVPGGIAANGRLYPDEFLLDSGRANYWVGTHYMVPKDGDYSHVGDLKPEELVEAPANRVLVWWWQMCAAREQANLNKLLEPQNPQGKTLGLVMKTVVIVAAVLTMYSTWGMRGEMKRAADTSVLVAGSVQRVDGKLAAMAAAEATAPAAPGAAAPGSVAPGAPIQPAAPVVPSGSPVNPGQLAPPSEPAVPLPDVQSALPTAPPQPACGRDPRLKPGEPTAPCGGPGAGDVHNDSVHNQEAEQLAKDAKLREGQSRDGHALDRARRSEKPVNEGKGGSD